LSRSKTRRALPRDYPPPHSLQNNPLNQPKIDNRPTLCVFGFTVYQIYNRGRQFVRARSERVWRWSDVWRSECTTHGKKPDVAVGGQGKRNSYKATTIYHLHQCVCVCVCVCAYTFLPIYMTCRRDRVCCAPRRKQEVTCSTWEKLARSSGTCTRKTRGTAKRANG